jgi:hypothetical protein
MVENVQKSQVPERERILVGALIAVLIKDGVLDRTKKYSFDAVIEHAGAYVNDEPLPGETVPPPARKMVADARAEVLAGIKTIRERSSHQLDVSAWLTAVVSLFEPVAGDAANCLEGYSSNDIYDLAGEIETLLAIAAPPEDGIELDCRICGAKAKPALPGWQRAPIKELAYLCSQECRDAIFSGAHMHKPDPERLAARELLVKIDEGIGHMADDLPSGRSRQAYAGVLELAKLLGVSLEEPNLDPRPSPEEEARWEREGINGRGKAPETTVPLSAVERTPAPGSAVHEKMCCKLGAAHLLETGEAGSSHPGPCEGMSLEDWQKLACPKCNSVACHFDGCAELEKECKHRRSYEEKCAPCEIDHRLAERAKLSPEWVARLDQLMEDHRQGKTVAHIPWPDEPPVVKAVREGKPFDPRRYPESSPILAPPSAAPIPLAGALETIRSKAEAWTTPPTPAGGHRARCPYGLARMLEPNNPSAAHGRPCTCAS